MLFTPVKPMLLTMGDQQLKNNSNYLTEIKWDGWRILIHKQGNRIDAYTRHGNKVTDKFPELQNIIKNIKSNSAIIDCEGVVIRNGRSVFDLFQYRGRLNNKTKIELAAETHPVTFVAFDILVTHKPLLNTPLIKRKEILENIIEPSNNLVVTPYITGHGEKLFQLTKENEMEGVVEKSIHSFYEINTRSSEWIKHKHFKRKNTIILGYKENPFTLIVGAWFPEGIIKPIAQVEFGFKPEEKQAFRQVAKGIISKTEKNVIWVEPVLCCEVQYLEKTEYQKLRIVSFKGFKFDINQEECLI